LGCGIITVAGSGLPPISKDPPTKDSPLALDKSKETPAEKAKEAAIAESLPQSAIARIGSTRYRASMRFSSGSYSRDGRWFVSGTDGVELWYLETGIPRQLMPVRNNTVPRPWLSPDGNLIAVLDGGPGIHVFDRVTGKELRTLGEKEAFAGCEFSPDGKRV